MRSSLDATPELKHSLARECDGEQGDSEYEEKDALEGLWFCSTWCLVLILRGPGVGLSWVSGTDDKKFCWLSGTIKEWRREDAFEEEQGVRYPGEDPKDEADKGSVT